MDNRLEMLCLGNIYHLRMVFLNTWTHKKFSQYCYVSHNNDAQIYFLTTIFASTLHYNKKPNYCFRIGIFTHIHLNS